jgi:pimeloyl-ACP methyl ester carboxylesterase
MTTAIETVDVHGVGPVPVRVADYGAGQPFLLLHSGGGPATVDSFGQSFAAAKGVRVLVATHPGFDGTDRPDGLNSIRGLARLYVSLVEQLGLADVTVIGNSIGGWLAAEIGLIASPRVSGLILVDAVGIDVPAHPIADFFALTMAEVQDLSYYNPEAFRMDPETLPPASKNIVAGNRAALALYAGMDMFDPRLVNRLGELETATLVLWGDSDRIVDPDYGRAYAAALPIARFELLENTGHLPQLETPEQLMRAIWDCGDSDFSD